MKPQCFGDCSLRLVAEEVSVRHASRGWEVGLKLLLMVVLLMGREWMGILQIVRERTRAMAQCQTFARSVITSRTEILGHENDGQVRTELKKEG